MNFAKVIATRRDRGVHTREELRFLAEAAAHGLVPDYQLSAWLMAAYLNPLDEDETADLTLAMADSGERLDLSGLPKPWVDKHSTGGVGDKTSLVLLPLLAACGITMVKMSGRGLGVTGGTVDKLGSIPGFRLDLTPDEMKTQAKRIGIALTGQSPLLAPADKVLYALRDVTGTTESIPLIVSSILSKKIAGGAETVVLDVKAGSGAFMKARAGAEELGQMLKSVGQKCGLRVEGLITAMDEPLGAAVGNALEVDEALAILRGDASGLAREVRDLCLHLAGITLRAVGIDKDPASVLQSGQAYEKAMEWFAAQGAFPGFALPRATVEQVVTAEASGWVHRFDAATVGYAVIDLGGGRRQKEDAIDPAVGIVRCVAVGESIEIGQPIATIHARDNESADQATKQIYRAIQIRSEPAELQPRVLSRL